MKIRRPPLTRSRWRSLPSVRAYCNQSILQGCCLCASVAVLGLARSSHSDLLVGVHQVVARLVDAGLHQEAFSILSELFQRGSSLLGKYDDELLVLLSGVLARLLQPTAASTLTLPTWSKKQIIQDWESDREWLSKLRSGHVEKVNEISAKPVFAQFRPANTISLNVSASVTQHLVAMINGTWAAPALCLARHCSENSSQMQSPFLALHLANSQFWLLDR